MNDSVVKLFCKKVGKRLRCMPDTKQVLLQGLIDELSERPHPDTASIAAIESNIGTVDQVAEALQATVPPEDMQRVAIRNRQRTILIVGAIILFSLLMLFLAIFIFCKGPFYVVETIQEG